MSSQSDPPQSTQTEPPSASWIAAFARSIKLCLACLALLWTMGVMSYVASGHVARISANRGIADALPGFAISAVSAAFTCWLFIWAGLGRQSSDDSPLDAQTAEAQIKPIGSFGQHGQELQATEVDSDDDERRVM